MEAITLRAHFDGDQIRLDEPFDLEPNARLIVTVLSTESDSVWDGWLTLAVNGLTSAYGVGEPDYSPEMIREWNEEYETG